MTASTTRRFGPRFSIFLEFMAGRNSTPSSRWFMSWERRQEGGKAVPRAWSGVVQAQSSLEQSYLCTAAPQRERKALPGTQGRTSPEGLCFAFLHTPHSCLSLVQSHQLTQAQG